MLYFITFSFIQLFSLKYFFCSLCTKPESYLLYCFCCLICCFSLFFFIVLFLLEINPIFCHKVSVLIWSCTINIDNLFTSKTLFFTSPMSYSYYIFIQFLFYYSYLTFQPFWTLSFYIKQLNFFFILHFKRLMYKVIQHYWLKRLQWRSTKLSSFGFNAKTCKY